MPCESVVDVGYACAGADGQRQPTVGPVLDAYVVVAVMAVGCQLLLGAAVADGYAPPVDAVDLAHLRHEGIAVGTVVVDFPVPDPVMDHLVDDGVLDFTLGEVEPCAYAHVAFPLAPGFPEWPGAWMHEHPERSPGVVQANRKRWQLAVKAEGIVFVKLPDNVIKCRTHRRGMLL